MYADAGKLRERHAEEILTTGQQQTTRFSMKSKNLEYITNMQWLCKTWAEKSSNILSSGRKAKMFFFGQISGIYQNFRRAELES